MTTLVLQHVSTGYHAPAEAISDINIHLETGELVAIIGPNGAGKSTTLKAISGLLRPWKGQIALEGKSLMGLSVTAILRKGVAQVPEGRRILPGLTVAENLAMGGYTIANRGLFKSTRNEVLQLFPILAGRLHQKGGTLSGGEQQMLAIARALMSRPKFLLLDEPSMGLAPMMVGRIAEFIVQLRERGLGLLLVEQNANLALGLANRAYVLEEGRIVVSGPAHSLREDTRVQRSYLAVT